MELTLESTRFFDLRRWGMLDQAMQAAGRTNFNAVKHSYLSSATYRNSSQPSGKLIL